MVASAVLGSSAESDADKDLTSARKQKAAVLAQLGAEYQSIEQNLFAQVTADVG